MENLNQNCQTCFKPIAAEGAPQKSQWISLCRCDRAYTPGSQFSIDVCANCKMRIPVEATGKVNCPGLCACETTSPKKVPTYLKQNESDAVTLDLSALGACREICRSAARQAS